jgi:choline-glycine betaine transporter
MEIYIAIFFFFILTVAVISFTEKLRQKEYKDWKARKASLENTSRRRSRSYRAWL